MVLRRLAAPAVAPIDAPLVRAQSRIDSTVEDHLLAVYIAAAVGHLDGAAGILGRCLIEQRWALDLDRFPCGPIDLPLPPLVSIEAVKYRDTADALQTLDPSAYVVHPGEFGMLEPAIGATWPATSRRSRAVSVEFTAGYGTHPGKVPGEIRSALLLMTADLHTHREAQALSTATMVRNPAVDRLLGPFRIPL